MYLVFFVRNVINAPSQVLFKLQLVRAAIDPSINLSVCLTLLPVISDADIVRLVKGLLSRQIKVRDKI